MDLSLNKKIVLCYNIKSFFILFIIVVNSMSSFIIFLNYNFLKYSFYDIN